MKARYTTKDSSITFEIDGENPKSLFREIAGIQEVFDGQRECGVCHGTEFRYQVRDVDDNDFYELVCLNNQCRARFSFGQHKKGGGLFPKRKDADGNWIENGGWVRYVKPGTESRKANGSAQPGYRGGGTGGPPPRDEDFHITDDDVPF